MLRVHKKENIFPNCPGILCVLLDLGAILYYNVAIPTGACVIMFGKNFQLNEQTMNIVEQIGMHMPGGFFIYRAEGDGELLYANPSVFGIFGCRDLSEFRELTGFTFKGMLHPDDYQVVQGSIHRQIAASEYDLDYVEYRVIRRDGAVRWVDDYGHYTETEAYGGIYYVFISDITEKRERMETDSAVRLAVIEALSKSYHTVWLINDVETEAFSLYFGDKSGSVHSAPINSALERMKYTQAKNSYVAAFAAPDERERLYEELSIENIVKNIREKPQFQVGYRRVTDEGEKYYRIEFAKVDMPGGRTGVVCGFKDVDEEVRGSMKLREDLSIRSAVIEALTRVYDSLWLINDLETQRFSLFRVDDNMSHMMPAGEAAKLTKYYDAFKYYSNLVLPEDRQRFLEEVTPESILKNTENSLIYSVPFRRMFEDGVRYYRVEFAKLELGGKETGIVCGFKDVDDMVKKEMQLHQSITIRSAVIEALTRVYDSLWLINDVETQSFMLYRIDEKMSHLMPANAASKLTKFYDAFKFYSNLVLPEDRQGFLDAVTPESIVKNTANRLVYSVPFRRVFDEGVRYYRVEFAKLELDAKETGIVCGFKDVDEEVRAEQEIKQTLRDATEAANASSKAKSNFLSGMSHDMRTPMNGIMGMTAIASAHLDDRERVADCLNKIQESSAHLLALINEVLDMNKIESGKVELAEEPFDLSELIDSLLSMTRPQIEAKRHSLSVHIDGVTHEKVVGDSVRVKQVFVNLLSNAIKYTPDGGRISISIGEQPSNLRGIGLYRFVFEDNGIGMMKEYLEHIFEPFSRANDIKSAGVQGTGLGMAITRNIVQMMSGDIHVESTYGVGSKFTVTLYLRIDDEKAFDSSGFDGLHVLVADDDPKSCESACGVLNDLGMNSEWVLSGHSAVERVQLRREQGRDFSAVIIDWKMPGMDGIETTRRIRQAVGEGLPIIILSAFDWTDIEQEAREAGASYFISKPLFRTKLARVFNSILNGNAASEDAADPFKKLEELSFENRRVLLAEDNPINAEIAINILDMTGLEVDHAENGQAAVERFKKAPEGHYSMIFMDIQMPVLDGYAASKAIRVLDRPDAKTVPIVAMTANAFDDDKQNALKAGMNGHISKPLNFDELAAVLTKYVK